MAKTEVRDGYLKDLPENIQKNVMEAHKIVIAGIDEVLDDPNYADLKDSRWAMSCLDDFKTMPTDKGVVGSVRVFKKMKTYSCMIQLTGHFRNHQYGWIEELLHEFMKNVFITIRPRIRRKLDMTLKNEGDMGNPEEGFDIYPNKKVAEEMWNKFEDRKTMTMKESYDDPLDFEESSNMVVFKFKKLPEGLKNTINDTNALVVDTFIKLSERDEYRDLTSMTQLFERLVKNLKGERTRIKTIGSGYIDGPVGIIQVTPPLSHSIMDESNKGNIDSLRKAQDQYNKLLRKTVKVVGKKFDNENPGKILGFAGDSDNEFVGIMLSAQYVEKLKDYLKNPKKNPITESVQEYNRSPRKTETQIKKSMAVLSQNIIDGKEKVTQSTFNTYANLIRDILPKWCSGYNNIKITMVAKHKTYFEFNVPKMTQDFVSRFINGRETISGFLHRSPEIKLRMSADLLYAMKDADDAYNFFKAAIKYYDTGLEKASLALMSEIRRLGPEMKGLIATTNMSALVIYPLKLLFVYDCADITSCKSFSISKSDIEAVNKFIREIHATKNASDQDKKNMVSDIKTLVNHLRNYTEAYDTSMGDLSDILNEYYSGKYDKDLSLNKEQFISEQIDIESMNESDVDTKYIREKFGVKKLKKIPTDLIAYISIETEAIKDANDKMMIASYCLGKIDIVEWYIELLDAGSTKYIVPHNRQYLENVRTQLLACYKKIMATPIPKKKTDEPLLQYPKGYEG